MKPKTFADVRDRREAGHADVRRQQPVVTFWLPGGCTRAGRWSAGRRTATPATKFSMIVEMTSLTPR